MIYFTKFLKDLIDRMINILIFCGSLYDHLCNNIGIFWPCGLRILHDANGHNRRRDVHIRGLCHT